MQAKSRLFSAIFFITVVLQPCVAVDALPDFGGSEASVLSKEQEVQLGSLLVTQIRRSLPVLADPLITDYIQTLGNELVNHSTMAGDHFRFFVIKDHLINAFALPGGNIVLHSGLILIARNESELAAVMAHEIAHVTQRHIARLFERSKQFSLPTLAALFGSILLATQNSTAGAGALVATMGTAQQLAINFTRDNEQEADRVGIELLAASGLNPMGMPDFFGRMQQGNRYNETNYPEFLRTHPVNQARIADSTARAERYPPYRGKENPAFMLMRNRIDVMLSENIQATQLRYQHALEEHPLDDTTKYGYALVLLRNNKFSSAANLTQQLLNKNPNEVAYHLLAADLDFASGAHNKALQRLNEQLLLHPHQHAIAMSYANLLLQTGDNKKAESILGEQRYYNPEDPSLYELLTQAQSANGNAIAAHQSRAEYLALYGDLHGAIAQLDIALKQSKGASYDTARFKARRAELAQLQKRQESSDW